MSAFPPVDLRLAPLRRRSTGHAQAIRIWAGEFIGGSESTGADPAGRFRAEPTRAVAGAFGVAAFGTFCAPRTSMGLPGGSAQ